MLIVTNKKPSIHRAGFGIFEVLIAMLLISVTLFGVTRLATSAFSGADYANHQKQVELAKEFILQRINANLKQVNGSLSATHYAESSYAADGSLLQTCQNNNCTQDQQALYDLYQWKQYLATLKIDSLHAIVCRDNATPGIPTPTNPNCSGSGGVYIKLVWNNRLSRQESNLNTLKNYLIVPVMTTTNLALFTAWSAGGGAPSPFTPIDVSGINAYWATSWWPNNQCDGNEKCNGTPIFGACGTNEECIGSIMEQCYSGSDRCNNSIVFGQCDASNRCDNSIILGNCNSQVNDCSDSIIAGDCNATQSCEKSVILGSCHGAGADCSNSIIYGDCNGKNCTDSIIYGNCYGNDCRGSYIVGNCTGKCNQTYVGGSCWGSGCGSGTTNNSSLKDILLSASGYNITKSAGGWYTITRNTPLSFYDNQVNIDTVIIKSGGVNSGSYNCSGSDCSNSALYGQCTNGATCDGSAIYGTASTSCSGRGTNCRNATIENGCNAGADCSNSIIKGSCSGSGTSCQNAVISGQCTNGANCSGSKCNAASGTPVNC